MMAKVTYNPKARPDEIAPDETDQYGYHFEAGKAIDVDNEKQLAKFKGNPYFKVAGETKAKALPPIIPTPEPERHSFSVNEVSPGSFVILDGQAIVLKDLSRDDVDAFNDLSDEEKIDYVTTKA